MDPVSAIGFATSVGQLAGFATAIVGNMWKYFDAVKNAPKRSEELRQEMANIATLLDSLDDLSTESLFTNKAPLSEFLTLLKELNDRVAEPKTKGFGRWKWPFSQDENKRLLSRLERYTMLFNFVTNVQTKRDVKVIVNDVQLKKRRRILEWLSPGSFTSRHEELQKTRVENSGGWFLGSEQFTCWVEGYGPWLKDGGPDCLVCTGIPGAGKSVLMSIVIDYLLDRQKNDESKVAYAYMDYKTEDIQTINQVARSLLKQLMSESDIPEELEVFYDKNNENNTLPAMDTMYRLFRSYSQNCPIFIVFDAMDEYGDSDAQEQMLSFLSNLQKSSFRVLISSRPHVQAFKDCLNNFQRIDIIADEHDLRNYVMARLKKERNSNPALEARCLDLANHVNGLFLLARFQLDHILQYRETRKRLHAFKTIPKDMSSAYNDILQRIATTRTGDMELAMRILSWIYRAKRSLHMNELLDALVVEELELELSLDEVLQDKLTPTDVIECCKSLVIYESSSGLLRFTHFTVQEFIDKNPHILPSSTHLAKTCLAYLAFPELERCAGWEVDDSHKSKYAFCDYATVHWVEHIRGEPETSFDVQRAFVYCFGRPEKAKSILLRGHRVDVREISPNDHMLFTALYLRLAIICQVILRGNMEDVPGVSLTLWNEMGLTPLNLAAMWGHEKVIEAFVAAGADLNIQDTYGKTALHNATRMRDSRTVEKLLAAGADISVLDLHGWTALHEALATGSDYEVIKRLLDAGVNVSLQDRDGRTALHLAVLTWKKELVSSLVTAGADTSLRDHDGRTALSIAVTTQNMESVEILLAAGADASVRDNMGQSAMHDAVALNNYKMVDMLLSAGADVIPQNRDRATPLSLAMNKEVWKWFAG